MKTDYQTVCSQLTALTSGVEERVSNLANAASLLYFSMADVNWAGFYVARGDTLALGPFVGKPACVTIPFGKGVCGTAAALDQTQLVPYVHNFKGHIACDAASNAEIVIPIHNGSALYGVLDIDSELPGRFTEEDAAGLEEFVRTLERALFGQ